MAASDLIGAMRITLGLDSAQFTTGLSASERQAQQSSKRMNAAFRSAGEGASVLKNTIAALGSTAIVSSLVAVSSKALDYASSLGETAQQLGVTTEALQVYRYAGTQVGVTTDQMDKALAKLTQTMGQARDGFKQSQAPFNELSKILGKDILKSAADAGDAIPLIADALAKIPDPAQRAALEVALFGRAGQKLDTLLAGGSAQINELRNAAQSLGIVLSQDEIANADATADKISELKTVLEANIAGEVANNAQAIYDFVSALEKLVAQIPATIRWMKEFDAQGRLFGARVNAVSAIYRGDSKGLSDALAKGDGAYTDLTRARAQDKFYGFSASDRAKIAARMKPSELNALGIVSPSTKTATQAIAPQRNIDLGGAGAAAAAKAARDAAKAQRAAQREAEKEADRQRRYDQELARSQEDYLGNLLDLTVEQADRSKIEHDLLDREHQARLDQINSDRDTTDAQKAKLRAVENDTYSLKQIVQDRKEEQAASQAALDRARAQTDNQTDILRAQSDLAKSTKARRDIELKLLDLQFQQLQAEQDAIIASKDSTQQQKDLAAQRKKALGTLQTLGRSSIDQQYASPIDKYLSDIPKTSDDMRDALQTGVVDGANAAIDGIVQLQQEFLKLPGVVGNVVNAVLADLEKIALEQGLRSLFQLIGIGGGGGSGLTSSLSGFSLGQATSVSSVSDILSGLNLGGARAAGGPTIGGKTYLVGERGPELFTSPSSGYVVANEDMSASRAPVTVLVEANDYFDAKVAGTSADVSSRVVGENNRVQSRAASRRLR